MNAPVRLRALLLAAACLSATSALAQNLVRDAGFEEPGAFEAQDAYAFGPSWTATRSHQWVFKYNSRWPGMVPASGSYFAALGSDAPGETLSQSLSTFAGVTYRVSFKLMFYKLHPGTPNSNSFTARFGSGTSVTEQLIGGTSGYQTISFDGVATGSSTKLEFQQRNTDFWFLDDVSVTLRPVPEPASLVAFGLGASAMLRRRKKT